MSEDVDWGTYVQGTYGKYVVRYLAHAEAHGQPIAADYDALEGELPNILGSIEQAGNFGAWSSIISMVYALIGCLSVRGYWDESARVGYLLAEAAERTGDRRAEGWAWTSTIGWTLVQQGYYDDGRKAVERGWQAFK